eukprot:TRINITY_DN80823_c0_g1_i1.p1 TRINITY_DN80823_c0_g1~~TRINITY_DN80823_c0_g1_i1.p1  ORF type:complete len:304 (-),score=55.94 TRINITY_DN80823_c0_g1_i1:227-1138(-)
MQFQKSVTAGGASAQSVGSRVSSFVRPPVAKTHSLKISSRSTYGRSRGSVIVEANIFSRIWRVARSYANSLVSAAEDPEKILDQAVTDMENDVIKMRQASAQVMASFKRMDAKYQMAQSRSDEWLKRAELALSKGEEALAREALVKKKAFQEEADSFKAQLEQQKKAMDQLIANTRQLENKVAEAKSKKETLKARAASAKTAKQVQEMVGALDTSSAVGAFEKMEEKVMALEGEAESVAVLNAGDGLEQKFKALEGDSVEAELAAMKKGMLSGSAPKQLPEGTPIKDAIDLELEQLRQKAKES